MFATVDIFQRSMPLRPDLFWEVQVVVQLFVVKKNEPLQARFVLGGASSCEAFRSEKKMKYGPCHLFFFFARSQGNLATCL